MIAAIVQVQDTCPEKHSWRYPENQFFTFDPFIISYFMFIFMHQLNGCSREMTGNEQRERDGDWHATKVPCSLSPITPSPPGHPELYFLLSLTKPKLISRQFWNLVKDFAHGVFKAPTLIPMYSIYPFTLLIWFLVAAADWLKSSFYATSSSILWGIPKCSQAGICSPFSI